MSQIQYLAVIVQTLTPNPSAGFQSTPMVVKRFNTWSRSIVLALTSLKSLTQLNTETIWTAAQITT